MLVDLYTYFCENSNISHKVIGSNYLSAEYKCPIDVEHFKFWNEMHIISYVVSGRKDWYVGGETYEVKGGDAVFIKKGVYATKQYFEVDHCIIVFMLNDDFIRKFLLEYDSLQLATSNTDGDSDIYRIEVNEGMQSIIYSVANYLKQGRDIPQELVEIKFKELLFNLVLNPGNRGLADYFNSLKKSERSDIEFIMNKYFCEDLGLEEFARMTGRSLSTFKRDFQEFFGTTPGKWLSEKRLDFAKSLLISTNRNISEICYESGFKNNSHFNKAFKERFQLPPLQFRQSIESKNN